MLSLPDLRLYIVAPSFLASEHVVEKCEVPLSFKCFSVWCCVARCGSAAAPHLVGFCMTILPHFLHACAFGCMSLNVSRKATDWSHANTCIHIALCWPPSSFAEYIYKISFITRFFLHHLTHWWTRFRTRFCTLYSSMSKEAAGVIMISSRFLF